MKVLLLGANGFIGSKLLALLLDKHIDVKILTRRNSGKTLPLVEVVVGDLTDPDFSFESLVRECDVIFNCAGEIKSESLMEGLHVGATRKLISAVYEVASPLTPIHWVQLSSVGAYGAAGGVNRMVTETTPLNPSGMYETTKTEADLLIMNEASGRNSSLSWTIVRPSNVFGPCMPNGSLRQLSAIVRKRLFFYIGYSPAIATYVHVDDVVALLELCGFDPRAKKQVFNISNDCPLKEVIDGIAHAISVPEPKLKVPEWLVRLIVVLVPDFITIPITQQRIDALVARTTYPSAKVKAVLGFVPKKRISEHISDVFQIPGP